MLLLFLKIHPPQKKRKTFLIVPSYDDSTCYRRRDGEIINGVNLGMDFIIYFENLASYCFGFYKVLKRGQDEVVLWVTNKQWCSTAVRKGAMGRWNDLCSQATSAFQMVPYLSSAHPPPTTHSWHHSPLIHAPQWHGHVVGTKEWLKPDPDVQVNLSQPRNISPVPGYKRNPVVLLGK